MKKIRIAVTALILGVSLMAFTNADQQKNDEKQPWYYTLNDDDVIKYNDPGNYQATVPPGSEPCNVGSDVLCSIMAENDGNNHPILDPNVPVTKDGSQYSQTKRAFNEEQ